MNYLLPLEANLKVVIELDEAEEVAENGVRLVFGDPDDALGEVGGNKNGLPTGYGICPDDRVDGLKVVTDISRRATLP